MQHSWKKRRILHGEIFVLVIKTVIGLIDDNNSFLFLYISACTLLLFYRHKELNQYFSFCQSFFFFFWHNYLYFDLSTQFEYCAHPCFIYTCAVYTHTLSLFLCVLLTFWFSSNFQFQTTKWSFTALDFLQTEHTNWKYSTSKLVDFQNVIISPIKLNDLQWKLHIKIILKPKWSCDPFDNNSLMAQIQTRGTLIQWKTKHSCSKV